jgi:Xaa-Pro aminopeptidase
MDFSVIGPLKKSLTLSRKRSGPVYEKYAGIGIRIEDDVLITDRGQHSSSENAPKTVEDIESAMRK